MTFSAIERHLKLSLATFKFYVASQEGGVNNNQHSYTCAVRCEVLFVQTVGQFKAHSRTCFPIKPSLVFYPFSSKYYHIWPLDLWREALLISSTARLTEACLTEANLSNAPSNLGSPNFPGQLLHLSEPASALLEPTPRFRVNRGREAASTPHAEWQLLQVQPHGMEKYFRTMATAVKPTKPAVGQKATCPGMSPALQADVTF